MIFKYLKFEEFNKSKSYEEPFIISSESAFNILNATYGSNFLAVENNEFKIEEWQAAKKIYHYICSGVKPEDFGFSQAQADSIKSKGGLFS